MADERKITSWGDLLTRTMELGLGAATLTAETAQRVVNELVGRGEVAREEGATIVDRLMAAGREQRDMLTNMVEQSTRRALERMDLARRSDLEALRHRVATLEQAVLGHVVSEAPIPPVTAPTEEETTADQDYFVDQE